MPAVVGTIRAGAGKPTAKSTHAGDWQFVNLGPSKQGKEPDIKKLVRQNAMRDYRRKEKGRLAIACSRSAAKKSLEPQASYPTTSIVFPDISQPSSDTGEWETTSTWSANLADRTVDSSSSVVTLAQDVSSNETSDEGLMNIPSSHKSFRASSYENSPLVVLGSGDHDPFDIFPVSGRFECSRLLHHCQSPCLETFLSLSS